MGLPGGWRGEGGTHLVGGLTQMQVLLSCGQHAREGAEKGRWSRLVYNAPDLSVLALWTLLRGPERAHTSGPGRAGSEPQLHSF